MMSAALSRGSFYATPSTSSSSLVVQQQTQAQSMAQSVTVGGLGARTGSSILFDKQKGVVESVAKKQTFLDTYGLVFDMELDSTKSRGIARRGSEDCLAGFNNPQKNINSFKNTQNNHNNSSASAESYIRLLTRSHSHLEDQLRRCILDITYSNCNEMQQSLQQLKFELENRGFEIEIVAEQTQQTEYLNQGKNQKIAICYPHSYLACKGYKILLDNQKNSQFLEIKQLDNDSSFDCRKNYQNLQFLENNQFDQNLQSEKQKKQSNKKAQIDLSRNFDFEKNLFEKQYSKNWNQKQEVVIIDPFFQQQFEVATTIQPEYLSLVSAVPQVFVGTQDRLKKVVEKICSEMQISFQKCKIPLPPWRSRSNMLAKWQLQDAGGRGKMKGKTQFGEKMKELVKMDQDREFAKFSEFANAVKHSDYQQHRNLKTLNCEVDGYEGDSECDETKLPNRPRNLKEGQLSFALKRIASKPPLQKPAFLASQIQQTRKNQNQEINSTPVQPKSKSLLSSAVKKLVVDGKSPDSVLVHQQQQERGDMKNALQPVKSSRMYI